MTRPGSTTAAHSSGAPLPPPMRTSSGFLVTGRSGKMRIQSLPARFTWRVMAIRAASIWRDVKRPGSMACNPKSPKETSEPRQATPRLLPFCIFRNLVRFGDSMSFSFFDQPGVLECSRQPPSGDAADLPRKDLSFEHPDFDADDAVGGLGFGGAELDVGAECVQGNSSLAVRFDAAHLAAAQATGAADADPFGPELHGGGDRLLHGATKGHPALELGRDVFGDELGVGLRLANLLHVDEDFVVREGLHAGELGLTLGGSLQVADLQNLDALATFADDHA